MIRRLAEHLLRNRRVRRRLPNGVPIYVSPDSQLKYLKGRFDRDLIELAEQRVTADSVVWDIGANCGVFAFSAATARQIVAVEPDPFLADLLQRSVALNGVPVIIVPAAVHSSVGLASFSIASRGRASNHLTDAGHETAGGERTRIMVPALRLDDLLGYFEPPTLIKIDVEGAEVAALEGATRVLTEARPVLYLEATDATFSRCEAILREARYAIRKGADLNFLAEPVEQMCERVFG